MATTKAQTTLRCLKHDAAQEGGGTSVTTRSRIRECGGAALHVTDAAALCAQVETPLNPVGLLWDYSPDTVTIKTLGEGKPVKDLESTSLSSTGKSLQEHH